MSTHSPLSTTENFPDLVVAAIQMEPRVGCKADNVALSIRLIEQAAGAGAQIVVLPELANSGYRFASREEAFSLAEQVPGGETTRTWEALAQEMNIHIVAGIAERDGHKLYNAAVIIGPDGYIGTYRKLHLWGDEHLYFEAGDRGLPVFHTPLGRLAVIICYDGWFPEVYRLLALQGADIVCMPTNWVPMPGQDRHSTLMANTLVMANAHSNGLNVICANRVGTERDQLFTGHSLIVDAQGWPVSGPASAGREEVLYARLNLKASRQARHLNAFNHALRDRRSDTYDLTLGAGLPLPRP